MQDPYCYSDTHILKNKLGITNRDELSVAERKIAYTRARELMISPIKGKFDFKHLRAIHKYLFQDLYDWAGEVRTVDIAKGDIFCTVNFIDANADAIFTELKNENYLNGLGAGQIAKRLAYYLCEINTLHPFREGNGRTQREFIRQLAFQNDYFLSFKNISSEEMVYASKAGLMRDYAPMEELIGRSLHPM